MHRLQLAAMGLAVATAAAADISPQPWNLLWGFGGSSFQMEGAWNQDGKGLGTYDVYYHNQSTWTNVLQQTEHCNQTGVMATGDTAADHYHRWREDLGYLKQLGASAYRFSVSWPRILPDCSGAVNQAGIDYYNNIIDQLLSYGIEPYLTMFHWDLPQACQDQYGAFQGEKIVQDFAGYADVLLRHFGDRIRFWLTLNEAEANCKFGWEQGIFAPGIHGGDPSNRFRCLKYTHLAHATVVQNARKNYADMPNSKNWKFGLPAILTAWFPYDPSNPMDVQAAQAFAARDFGNFWDPTIFGDWSVEAKRWKNEISYIAEFAFSSEETALMKGTQDFVALNYYSANNVQYLAGDFADLSTLEANSSLYPPSSFEGDFWQHAYGPGFSKVINQAYERYKMDIHITEIGFAAVNESAHSPADVFADPAGTRQRFWQEHLTALWDVLHENVIPVKAVLAWALLDNFEWCNYEYRFGAVAVDFNSPNLTRTIKNSTFYISNVFSLATTPFGSPSAPSRPVSSNSSATGSGSVSTAATKSGEVSLTSTGAQHLLVLAALAVVGSLAVI